MRLLPFKDTQRVVIDPGEYYVSQTQEVISTLLGSCVSACLYDPVNRIFGMNHFLLAGRHQANPSSLIETEEGRYGMYAMELLINEMMKKGARRKNLQAKCFGGGNVLHLREDKENRQTVGDLNSAFIRFYLEKEKIPLVGASLGGNFGRNIYFVGTDFSVYVKRIVNGEIKQLEQEERIFWKKSIEDYEQPEKQTDFW